MLRSQASHDLVHGSFYISCDVRAHFENVPLHFMAFHDQYDAEHWRQAFHDPTSQGPLATFELLANGLAW